MARMADPLLNAPAMTMNRLRIVVSDLPARARPIDPEDLGRIFGGCGTKGQFCLFDSHCCKGGCVASFMNYGGACA
jgi:hypothetical protein